MESYPPVRNKDPNGARNPIRNEPADAGSRRARAKKRETWAGSYGGGDAKDELGENGVEKCSYAHPPLKTEFPVTGQDEGRNWNVRPAPSFT